MSLKIGQLSVGNGETERALREVLEEVGAPAAEEWTASITAASPTAAWEMAFEGAGRQKHEHIDWEIVERQDGARYRKLLHGKFEQSVEHVKRCARKLLWERIHFRENPLKAISPRLSDAFEEAVWSVLRHEEMKPVQVRFGIWREGFDGMKFVCKVEHAAVPSPDRQAPWSWWSSLVRTPEDLQAELQRALLMRRKRQAAAASTLARARRRIARSAAAAPAPAPVPLVAATAASLPEQPAAV